jgi:crotonobetainyl-CoA:carnitine CoA-transferase CaiB-like acyl-CoA transferase
MVSPTTPPGDLPLSGLRVLDVTRYVAGSYTTMLLAALGADVIKVEDVREGDPYRVQGTARVNGDSALFLGLNAGKRSLSIDLARPESREILDRLLAQSDFLVENARPGSLRKFNLDYESVHTRFPHIVYVSISGYGAVGPQSTKGGFDLILQAESGVMSVTGEPDGPPTKVGTPLLDIGAGVSAVTAALAALYQRERTGQGCHVSSSLLQFALATFASTVTTSLASGDFPTRLGSHSPTFAPYGAFHTADDYIVLAGAGNDRLWVKLCEALNRADVLEDPRFASNADRVRHRQVLTELLEDSLGTQSASHWISLFEREGIPVARVRSLQDVLAWDQIVAMGLLEEISPKGGEPYTVVDPPFTINGPLHYRIPAPRLGEHTQEVLHELQIPRDQVDALTQAGVVRTDSHD